MVVLALNLGQGTMSCLSHESFTYTWSLRINYTSLLKLSVSTENLSALLFDFNPSISKCQLLSSPSAPSPPPSSYPACTRSWCSRPGSQVLPSLRPFHALRTTFAASSFCIPQQPNHPIAGTSFLLQPDTRHTSQATMSVTGSFPNNNNHTHMEIQLASRSRIAHPQSNNHRRGQCNLYKSHLGSLLLPTDTNGECLIYFLFQSLLHSHLQPSVILFRYAMFQKITR